MKQYVCEINIPKKEFDRINRLLKEVDFNYEDEEEMSNIIDELDARKETMPYGFCFEFDDGSKIYIDICSGTSNYYDNCWWVSADCKEDYVFDCFYEITKENEFIHNNTSYICKFVIEEN